MRPRYTAAPPGTRRPIPSGAWAQAAGTRHSEPTMTQNSSSITFRPRANGQPGDHSRSRSTAVPSQPGRRPLDEARRVAYLHKPRARSRARASAIPVEELRALHRRTRHLDGQRFPVAILTETADTIVRARSTAARACCFVGKLDTCVPAPGVPAGLPCVALPLARAPTARAGTASSSAANRCQARAARGR